MTYLPNELPWLKLCQGFPLAGGLFLKLFASEIYQALSVHFQESQVQLDFSQQPGTGEDITRWRRQLLTHPFCTAASPLQLTGHSEPRHTDPGFLT